MNKISIVVLFSAFLQYGYAQSVQRYQYVKLYDQSSTYWQLVNGSETITLSSYQKIEGGKERTITTAQGKLSLAFMRGEKQAVVKDGSGQILATYPDRGKKVRSVSLPDGTYYQWKKDGNNEWRYLQDDREILVCTLTREGGKRFVNYELKDPQAKGMDVLMLASHDLANHVIINKAKAPFLWGVIIALAVARAATLAVGYRNVLVVKKYRPGHYLEFATQYLNRLRSDN